MTDEPAPDTHFWDVSITYRGWRGWLRPPTRRTMTATVPDAQAVLIRMCVDRRIKELSMTNEPKHGQDLITWWVRSGRITRLGMCLAIESVDR